MISGKNARNWILDFILLINGLLVMISGLPFLFASLKIGRGPDAVLAIGDLLIKRNILKDFHTWAGLAMVVIVIIHLGLHWKWIIRMFVNLFKTAAGNRGLIKKGARKNLIINSIIAVSFLIVSISGLYFVFGPSGGYQGGRNPQWQQVIIFTRSTWSTLHDYAGLIMIGAFLLHFIIHWRWMKNVAKKMFTHKGKSNSEPKWNRNEADPVYAISTSE